MEKVLELVADPRVRAFARQAAGVACVELGRALEQYGRYLQRG